MMTSNLETQLSDKKKKQSIRKHAEPKQTAVNAEHWFFHSHSLLLSVQLQVGRGRCPDRRLVDPEGGGVRRARRRNGAGVDAAQNLKKVPQTELRRDPWIDFTPFLCPFDEKEFRHFCLLLPRWPGFYCSFSSYLSFFSG